MFLLIFSHIEAFCYLVCPVFLLGAVFGKLVEDTGLAKGIASAIIKGLGKERAILSVVLARAVLIYGGLLYRWHPKISNGRW